MLETLYVLFGLLAFCFLLTGLIQATYTVSFTGGNVNANVSTTVSGENAVQANPTVVKAQSGTLTTRTDGVSGVITLGAGHGIVTGQLVDLYWVGGKAYKATVGTVSGLLVPITAVTAGDALPALNFTISVAPRNAVAFNVIGNNMQALAASTVSSNCYFVFEQSDGTVHHVTYVTPTSPYMWASVSGVTNPIAGDTVASVFVSTDNTAADITDANAIAITN